MPWFVLVQHTPLMIACIRGNADIVNVLLKYGASVTLTDERSYNALDLAIEKGRWYVCNVYTQVGKLYLEYLDGSTGTY